MSLVGLKRGAAVLLITPAGKFGSGPAKVQPTLIRSIGRQFVTCRANPRLKFRVDDGVEVNSIGSPRALLTEETFARLTRLHNASDTIGEFVRKLEAAPLRKLSIELLERIAAAVAPFSEEL